MTSGPPPGRARPGGTRWATLHVWGAAPARAAWFAARSVLDRPALARVPGLRFARFLGTGHGRSFTPGDADWRHWALFATWADRAAAEAFDESVVARRRDAAAADRLRLLLRPVTWHGRWDGRTPFGPAGAAGVHEPGGPVAALTRARLARGRRGEFRRAVPEVVADLHRSPGLLLAFGVGETPLGRQGTVSVWRDAAAMRAFAHDAPAHRRAVRRTPVAGWYAEELFATFRVADIGGSHPGLTAGAEGEPGAEGASGTEDTSRTGRTPGVAGAGVAGVSGTAGTPGTGAATATREAVRAPGDGTPAAPGAGPAPEAR